MLELFQNIFAPPRHMILLVIAAWLGLTLAEKRAERFNVSKDDLNNVTFYGLLAFIVGGRLSFALQNLAAFTKSPLGVFSINPDLFDATGGIFVAIIVAMIYGQRKQLPFWNTLDALTPFFAIIVIGLGLSHLAAGTSFGYATDLPWGIDLWNATRHPTQIYEILASLLIFGLLWSLKPNPRSGVQFLSFAALTAISQIIILAFRADTPIVFDGYRQMQIIAWIVLAVSLLLIERRLTSGAK